MRTEWYAQGVLTPQGVLWRVQRNTSEHGGNVLQGLHSFSEAEQHCISLNYAGTRPQGLRVFKGQKL